MRAWSPAMKTQPSAARTRPLEPGRDVGAGHATVGAGHATPASGRVHRRSPHNRRRQRRNPRNRRSIYSRRPRIRIRRPRIHVFPPCIHVFPPRDRRHLPRNHVRVGRNRFRAGRDHFRTRHDHHQQHDAPSLRSRNLWHTRCDCPCPTGVRPRRSPIPRIISRRINASAGECRAVRRCTLRWCVCERI